MLGLRLDSLGNDEDPVFVRVSDNMAKKAFVSFVLVNSANVFNVDFDEVGGKIDHAGQIGVFGSKIIYSDLATERFQPMCDFNHEFALGRVDSFQYFKNDVGRRDAVFEKGLPYEINERQIGNVVGGKVDGKLNAGSSQTAKCFLDHDSRDGSEKSSLFRREKEFSRSDDGRRIARIAHANETFLFNLRDERVRVVVDVLAKRNEQIPLDGKLDERNHFKALAKKLTREKIGVE